MKTIEPAIMNSLDNLSPGAKATLGHLQEIMAAFSAPAGIEATANVASQKPEAAPATFAPMPKTPIKFSAKVVVDYRLIPYENIYDFGAEIDRLRDLVFQKANSLAEQFEVSIEDGYFGGWRFNLEVIFEADELARIAGAVAAFETWVAGTKDLKLGSNDTDEALKISDDELASRDYGLMYLKECLERNGHREVVSSVPDDGKWFKLRYRSLFQDPFDPALGGPTVLFVLDSKAGRLWWCAGGHPDAKAAWLPLTGGEFAIPFLEGYEADPTPLVKDRYPSTRNLNKWRKAVLQSST